MELMCFILHLLVKRTRFVRYYTACSRERGPDGKGVPDRGTGYRVHHDVTTEDVRFVSCPASGTWAGARGILIPGGFCSWRKSDKLGEIKSPL